MRQRKTPESLLISVFSRQNGACLFCVACSLASFQHLFTVVPSVPCSLSFAERCPEPGCQSYRNEWTHCSDSLLTVRLTGLGGSSALPTVQEILCLIPSTSEPATPSQASNPSAWRWKQGDPKFKLLLGWGRWLLG